MKRINLKPQTYMFPLPVLLIGTFDKSGNPDLMNAAWGGIYDTNQVILCLSSDRKTSQNILLNNCFTISFVTKEHVLEADYVGMVSGNNIDKISKLGLHYSKSSLINAPIFDEFPVCLECKVNKIEDDGTTMHVIGDIVNISVDEDYIISSKIDTSKFIPLTYDCVNNTYKSNGEVIDKAFSCYKKIK